MTYKDRKILLLNEGWTIQALADEYEKRKKKACLREEMSQCIRGVRVYQPLRDFLSELFEKPVTELFEAEEQDQKSRLTFLSANEFPINSKRSPKDEAQGQPGAPP